MKDYRLKVAVKNNYLLTAMEKKGFRNIHQLCAAYDFLREATVGMVANLKLSLYNRRGETRPIYLKLSRALICLPEDLIPPQHWHSELKKNTAELDVTLDEIRAVLPGYLDAPQLPDAAIEQRELSEGMERALGVLNPRQRFVIERRFGLGDNDEETYEVIAGYFGLTRERIRQIEAKALRILKMPRNAGELLSLTDFLHVKARKPRVSEPVLDTPEPEKAADVVRTPLLAITKMRQRIQELGLASPVDFRPCH